jgi:hypothetical protein
MRKSVLLLALFLLPITAQSSQAKGLYIGASVGAAMTNGIDEEDGVDVDDSGTGWEGLAGYSFAGPLGAELAYVDLGKVSAEGTGFSDHIKSHGVQFSAVATFPPASPFAAQARFGGFAWTQKLEIGDDTQTISDSENGTTVCAGLGLRYNMKSLDHLGINAKWTRYFDVGEGSGLDQDFFALGATWSFGSNAAAE